MNRRICLSAIFLAICVAADALAFVSQPCEPREGWTSLESTAEKPEAKAPRKVMLNLQAGKITLGQPINMA